MELTREQRQYIVEVLADIWGREHGVKLKAYKQYDLAVRPRGHSGTL